MKVNVPIALASLLLSVLLWLHVENERALRVSRPISMPLKYVNLSEQFVLKSIPATITLQAEGPVEAFDRFKEFMASRAGSSVYATVDLRDANAEVGTYRVRLPRSDALNRIGIELADPGDVPVSVEPIMGKSFPVEVVPTNVPAGFVYSQAEVRPATIMVKGAGRDLARVDKVRALLDLQDYGAGTRMTGAVEVLDASGKPMTQSLQIDPPTVDVFPALAAAPPERSLIIAVRIAEGSSPAAGFRLTGYTVRPQTVMVRGDQKLLERMQSIPTEQIRLSGMKTRATRRVRLIAPSGVQILASDRVDVTLDIEPIPIVEGPATPPANPTAPPTTSRTGGL